MICTRWQVSVQPCHSCDALTQRCPFFSSWGELTVSGLSSGRTLCPSKRKRTVDSCFPCLSQKAFINFSNFVDLLILKKTSLLLSVTLMFKCSVGGGGASCPPLGDCSFSDMMSLLRRCRSIVRKFGA